MNYGRPPRFGPHPAIGPEEGARGGGPRRGPGAELGPDLLVVPAGSRDTDARLRALKTCHGADGVSGDDVDLTDRTYDPRGRAL